MKVFIKKSLVFALSSVILTSCGSANGINSFANLQAGISSWSNSDTPILDSNTITAINNKTTLLVDKEQIFNEIYKVIDIAEKKIYITTYLFGGEVGHKIAEKLIAKKKQGVEVQFIAEETMGTVPALTEPAKKEFNFLIQNGVNVRVFPTELMPKGPTFLSNQKIITHAKMVIADDTHAIMGGMDFKETESINHDYMIRIEGQAVSELSKIGAENWSKARPLSSKQVKIKDSIQNNAGIENLPSPPIEGSNIEIGYTSFTKQSLPNLLIRNFNNAKQSINIEMLLLDHEEIVDTLIKAKNRGVNVRIILDEADVSKYTKSLERLPLEGMANFSAVMKLQDAGIEVKWYLPKVEDQVLHAKAASIDGQIFMTGSANYTYHALTRNHEISVAVNDPNLTQSFNNVFESDWSVQSKPAILKPSQRLIGKLFSKIRKQIYSTNESQIRNIPEVREGLAQAKKLGI